MAVVMGSKDAQLFELNNLKANEVLFRDRVPSSNRLVKTSTCPRGSSPGRMTPSPRRGIKGESQVRAVVRPRSNVNSPGSGGIAPSVIESQGRQQAAGGNPPVSIYAESLGTVNSSGVETFAMIRDPLGEEIAKKISSQTVLPPMDDRTLQKLAKLVVQEMQGVKKVHIRLDDFTGEKSPYLAEDAMVWLKKVRLAARQNEWDYAEALEVASIHLKGLAARWFASIEKTLNEQMNLDRDRWNYFQTQFEERFADFRSRLFQIEKIKSMKMRDGEDVRDYAETILSMNSRLEEPLDDELLRWVFIQGLPPSELKDKLYKFEENTTTIASAVKYARRLQLSQSVFNIKDSTPRTSPGSTPSRSSVRSN